MKGAVQKLIELGDQALQARAPYNPKFDELARFLQPEAAGFGAMHNPADPIMGHIRDSAALHAQKRWVAVMMQGMIPRNTRWHGLSINEDPDLEDYQPVREWLEATTMRLFRHRYAGGANFDAAMRSSFKSDSAIGTSVVYLESEPGGLAFRYQYLPLRECYLIADAKGQIGGLARRYERTAMQLVDEFGDKARANDNIDRAARKGDPKKFRVQHLVTKRAVFDPGRRDARNMPWQSSYVLIDETMMLRDGGYRQFPFLVGRLETIGAEPYGLGNGDYLLPDAKELNQMVATTTRQGMKIVDPPSFTSEFFDFEKISLNPGAFNRGGLDFRGNPQVRQVPPEGNPVLGLEMQDQKRRALDEGCGNSIFQLLKDNPQMTATEVIERVRRANALVAPEISQQETDKFAPLIAWELQKLAERGLMPPPPAELEGKTIVPNYSAPLLSIMRSDEAAATETFYRFALEAANAGDRSGIDILDGEEAWRIMATGRQVPAKALISRAEAAKQAKADAEEAARQQQTAEAVEAAKAAGAASPMVSALAGAQGGGA